MKPGVVRVESQGSLWFLDEPELKYLRMPKVEGHRERGPDGQDWGGPGAGHLQDLVWHAYHEWELRPRHLVIYTEPPRADGKRHAVVAPLPFEDAYAL